MGLLAHTEAAVKAVTALVIVMVILALLSVLQRVLEDSKKDGDVEKTA